MRPQQKKGRKTLKDCELKGQILRALTNNGNNCTSRQLFEAIKYGNYNSFRASLSRYVKQGYVKKYGNKRPFYYVLTKKGMEHAKDPLLLKKKRNFLYWRHISEILSHEEEFMKGMCMHIRHNPEAALREICKSLYYRDDGTFHAYYRKIIDEQNREIRDLWEILHRLGY